MTATFDNEPDRLSNYLVGRTCTPEIKEGFADAVAKLDIQFTPKQEKLYKSMMGSTFTLRAIDGGLAFVNPHSVIRKRIFIMLCLLEASTENTDKFLPVKRNWLHFFYIGLLTAYGFFTALIGILIIKSSGIE